MKTINYTGNSKLIARIVQLLNRKAPLPLDGDGDADWGTNGQVLTTDGQGNTSWTTPQGGGGDVTDVEVNGTSVVNAQGVAEVSVPTKTSDLTNDSGFITSADVPTKTSDLTNDSGFITSADVPTKTSDLTNDSGFITNLVNNLANYYTKSQTYTQAEVDALISGIVTLNILVVQALPTQDISTTTIYLVPKQDTGTSDIYDEYLYINNAWELIGTTQIDLSNYYTKSETDTLLNAKVSDNPTFTEASTRANIASGDSFSTILGKIKKFFTDLKTVAFTGAYSDLSGTPDLTNVAYKNVNNSFTESQTIDKKHGTAGGGEVYSRLTLGNATGRASAGHSNGDIYMYRSASATATTAYYTRLMPGANTDNRTMTFPNANGTVAINNTNNNFTYDQNINRNDGTTTAVGVSSLNIGNSTAEGTAKNSKGRLRLYGKGSYRADIQATNVTGNRTIEMPNASGTVALVSNLSTLNLRGNHYGLARFDGRINITIPFQGDFTAVSASKTTGISGTLYGSNSYTQCTFNIENLAVGEEGYWLYMNLTPSVTMTSYTAQGKITLVNISESVMFTLS